MKCSGRRPSPHPKCTQHEMRVIVVGSGIPAWGSVFSRAFHHHVFIYLFHSSLRNSFKKVLPTYIGIFVVHMYLRRILSIQHLSIFTPCLPSPSPYFHNPLSSVVLSNFQHISHAYSSSFCIPGHCFGVSAFL